MEANVLYSTQLGVDSAKLVLVMCIGDLQYFGSVGSRLVGENWGVWSDNAIVFYTFILTLM